MERYCLGCGKMYVSFEYILIQDGHVYYFCERCTHLRFGEPVEPEPTSDRMRPHLQLVVKNDHS